jgi:hypothetical protein
VGAELHAQGVLRAILLVEADSAEADHRWHLGASHWNTYPVVGALEAAKLDLLLRLRGGC